MRTLSARLFLSGLAVALLSCDDGLDPSDPPLPPPELLFPENFLWGTAIAGFQVDMGCPTIPADKCEDRASDWYQWVTDPDLLADSSTHLSGEPLSGSPGYFELFAEDARLAREVLGANAQRLSIEWSRLFPEEPVGATTVDDLAAFADPEAVAYYHALFAALKAQNLRPLVTLNHYTLPLWLHDGKSCHQDPFTCEDAGWLDRDRILEQIALYAGFCAREFGAEIDLWATLNEPVGVVASGFLLPSPTRTNPPGISNPSLAVEALFAMIEGHARMYDAVHAEDVIDADGDGVAAEVGLVHNLAPFIPANPDNPQDVLAAEHAEYLFDRVFLNGAILGELDRDLDGVAEEFRPDLEGRMDYLGINYYTRGVALSAGGPIFPEFPTFDFVPLVNFDVVPEGIYDVVMLGKEYGRPMIITENGVSDPLGDDTGPSFLVSHLSHLHRAITDGADVRGYFYWSLMDNYEWNHGLTAFRFGLFAVDPDDPTKTRTPRPSAGVFRQITDRNGLPSEVRAEFDTSLAE